MHDLMNNIHVARAISPTGVLTNLNTAYVSQIADMQGYESLTLIILSGVNTDADATFTTLIEDSDDSGMAGATAVADNELLGTEALASFLAASDDNTVFKIGYNGHKRYVRATITPAANGAGDALVAAVWLYGHPHFRPTPNPPA